ncbi:MAG: aminoacyl-histidine dipeptidase [Flavobacteriales bacterium]|nr:aminoacyl-histidine dipeptidase [Flavobacteriales bacterium]
MSQEVRELAPKEMWNHFADLNAVPRPSKKEERISAFMMEFGKSLGLETLQDEIGNVIIRKPASKGMENKQTVVLQSHLDMVHQKNASTNFDFNTQGIEMFVDNDWVKAKGTTLGADNGIGVASIMTVLASDTIPHPPIEALFTIDEETGMTGALNLKGGLLNGKILLNLDTEDDDELTIGCAGGIDVTANGIYTSAPTPAGTQTYKITVNGLTGGHSGMDIHRNRGNANMLMNRILTDAATKFGVHISTIDGGGLRNAIPRESVATVAVSADAASNFEAFVKETGNAFKSEYKDTDPNLAVSLEKTDAPQNILPADFQQKFLKSIADSTNGVYKMSQEIQGLVQTSNNVARILVKDGTYTVMCLTRSSVDAEKMELAEKLKTSLESAGGKVDFAGAYPGWTPKPGVAIVKIMDNLYRELYKSEPKVSACHAGLECGILGANYPDMEMISFGPNIRGAHSPDEKVQISSVHKYWQLFLETLKHIPEN